MKQGPASKWVDATTPPTEQLDDEVFQLFLQEGERAILDVERRPDEPERREGSAGPEGDPSDVSALRQALAELVDAYPGIERELGVLADRGHMAGTASAALELEARPHLLQLVRLSLEVFFRRHPSADSFERARDDEDEDAESTQSAAERYRAQQDLLRRLKRWTS
jgi:hypothetical protein